MVDYLNVWIALLAAFVVYLTSQGMAFQQRAIFCVKHGCKAPPSVPRKWYLFGIDNVSKLTTWAKDRVFLEEIINLFKISGSRTVVMNVSGMNIMWTMSPENAKAMMASKADDFQISQYRIDAFRPYTGDSVASSNGATWAHGRAILRSSFAKAQVSNFDIYERHFQELVANIPTNGSTVDLKVLFSRLTLDVATEIIFGESINSLQSDAPQSTRDIDEAFDLATQGVGDRLRLGPFMFFHRDPKFKRAIGILDKYTGAIIEKALREMEFAKRRAKDIESRGKVVFLNELIKDTSDEKRIRDLLLNALLGGRDTTMALLSHAFINLSQNKEALKQLQAEISQLEGLAPTYEQIKDLKYLRWVIDETLRLTPSAPLWDREAKRDLALPNGGGLDGKSPLYVPKGQTITYSFYGLCHSEEEWGPDVEEFRPERWDGLKYSWHFTPFGGGGRVCPGQQLALNQASYILVRMLQTFSGLESGDHTPWQEELGITLAPYHGCKVILTR